MSMKKSVHSESEMVKAVQELENGINAETVARNHGISKATLYNWKSKYSGMDVSQIRRLKELEEENRKLKQMYADLALDNRILKDVIEKKLCFIGKIQGIFCCIDIGIFWQCEFDECIFFLFT